MTIDHDKTKSIALATLRRAQGKAKDISDYTTYSADVAQDWCRDMLPRDLQFALDLLEGRRVWDADTGKLVTVETADA